MKYDIGPRRDRWIMGQKSDAKTGGSVSRWIYICTLACMYACVCVCMCVYGGEKGKWERKRKTMEKRQDAAVM